MGVFWSHEECAWVEHTTLPQQRSDDDAADAAVERLETEDLSPTS